MATHLENHEKLGNLRVVGENGKVTENVCGFTVSIALDTKYARNEFFTR